MTIEETNNQAQKLEIGLITKFKPKFNIVHTNFGGSGKPCVKTNCIACGTEFMQNRSWQRYCKQCR